MTKLKHVCKYHESDVVVKTESAIVDEFCNYIASIRITVTSDGDEESRVVAELNGSNETSDSLYVNHSSNTGVLTEHTPKKLLIPQW